MPDTAPLRERVDWLARNDQDGTLLVRIPRGPFLAGGTSFHEGDCQPFWVDLPAFYLALHPVTNAQYKLYLDATGESPPLRSELDRNEWSADSLPPEKADHPVVGVTWHEATSYCQWAGARLPSELEWEKGARGDDGRVYPWGRGWHEGHCHNDLTRRHLTTTGVWDYPQGCSVWGCYQMSGNVWEWCVDGFETTAYKRYARGDFSVPETDRLRVARGGSWFNTAAENFRAAYRHGHEPDEGDTHYGFRVAMDERRGAFRRR